MVQTEGDIHKHGTIKGDANPPKAGKRVAMLTSGGDSAGMSAAVRAVIRFGIKKGCEMFVIREGWEGCIRGNEGEGKDYSRKKGQQFLDTYGEGELLKEGEAELELKGRFILRVGWDDVRGFASAGGTLIGTARSAAFRELEGRRKAAHNLIKNGIEAVICCGGDGSLTGADKLRAEWPEHVKHLLKDGKITKEQAEANKHLNIVGLVGSIDNDMAGTDLTIGASTALHRVCEAMDNIATTASSHSRAFVVEVMGRHCGWLALMAAISTGADFLLIPEQPPTADDWEAEMCELLKHHRALGKRKSIIIVAEGAIDKHLKPIKAEHIRHVLTHKLGLDTRVTTLGHTQRGGNPCALDRVLATLQGYEAVEAVVSATADTKPPVIGLTENKIIRIPLLEAVEQTQAVAAAIEAYDFGKAISLRDPEFEECLIAHQATTVLNETLRVAEKERRRFAIVNVGAPAPSMNTAVRTAVRFCHARGHTPLGIYNGFPGLLDGHVSELSWLRVDHWATRGGSELGTNRKQPSIDLQGVAHAFAEHKIDGLLVIGGYEAYTALVELENGRAVYPEFQIPLVHLPATISNNVPVSDFSLGSDTSINVLVENCDIIKQSASASRSRVFVVETQGGVRQFASDFNVVPQLDAQSCGYIATVGALAAGAVITYTPERGISLAQLSKDVEYLKDRYQTDPKGKSEGRLVIRSEKASKVYTTSVVTEILNDEGEKLFDARSVQLGHTLQGGVPSPRDRTRAVRFAVRCMEFLEQHACSAEVADDARLKTHRTRAPKAETSDEESNVATLVIQGAALRFVGMREMTEQADTKNRRGKTAWWQPLSVLVEIVSGRKPEDMQPLPGDGKARFEGSIHGLDGH